MEEYIWGFIFLVYVFGGNVYELLSGRVTQKAWVKAARNTLFAIEAEDITNLIASEQNVSARVGSLTIELANNGEATRVTVRGMGILGQLSLRGARKGRVENAISRRLGEHDTETGDPEFDERVAFNEGPALLGRALLGESARSSFLSLVAREIGVVIKGDAVTATVSHSRLKTALTAIVEDLVAFARTLIVPDDVPSRIGDTIRSEPVAAVRRNSLRALVRELPNHPATLAAVRAAVDDPDVEVRLHAASALARSGDEAALLDFVRDDRSSAEHAARAITEVGAALSSDAARELIVESLRVPARAAVANACLEALGEGDRSDADTVLVAALSGGDYSDEMSLVAAHSLGRVGSASAIPALRAAASAHSGYGFGRAARQAVAEIQARVDAVPGQLSITGGAVGQLSLPPREPGELRVADASGAEPSPQAAPETDE